MQIVIMSDFHSHDPSELIKKLFEDGFRKFYLLGDFDEPKILEKNLSHHLCLGNHEIELVDGVDISSGYFLNSTSYYHGIWNHGAGREFVMNHRKKTISRKSGMSIVSWLENKKILFLHGSLSYAQKPDENPLIWGSLSPDRNSFFYSDIKKNFFSMKQRNIDILFRGHDHEPIVFEEWFDSSTNFVSYPEVSGKFSLKEARYIITVGAFCEGNYCVYDSINKTVDFRKFE